MDDRLHPVTTERDILPSWRDTPIGDSSGRWAMSTIRTVLVTGADGFVGRALVPALRERGFAVTAATRATVGEVGPETDWAPHLQGIDAIVHLAARVHVMRETVSDVASAYDRTNRAGTARLAAAASAALPDLRAFLMKLATVSLGWAPFESQSFTFASSSSIVDGSVCGL